MKKKRSAGLERKGTPHMLRHAWARKLMGVADLAVVKDLFFFSSRRRHTRCGRDWSSDVCSSDLSVSGALRMVKRHARSKAFTSQRSDDRWSFSRSFHQAQPTRQEATRQTGQPT